MDFKQKTRGKAKNRSIAFKNVNQWWQESVCIRVSPNKNDTIPTTATDIHVPKRYLILTLREAWQTYMAEFPDAPCSLTYFASLRPWDVFLLNQIPHNTCLCIYCENYESSYTKLREIYPQLPKYSSRVLEDFVCDEPTNMCWNNTCTNCRDGKGFMNDLGVVDRSLARNVNVKLWTKKDELTSKGVKYTRTALQTVTKEDLLQFVIQSKITVYHELITG